MDPTERHSYRRSDSPLLENGGAPGGGAPARTPGQQLLDLFQHEAAELTGKAQEKFIQLRNRHQAALMRPPEVAILLKGGPSSLPPRPAVVEPETLVAEAEVEYRGRRSRLMLLRPRVSSSEGSTKCTTAHILELAGAALGQDTRMSDKAWPLHDWDASEAVMALHVLHRDSPVWEPEPGDQRRCSQWFNRTLWRFALRAPPDQGPYLKFLRETYGENVAAAFSYKYFHAQMLWLMAAICAVSLILQTSLDASSYSETMQRRAMEVSTVAWGLCTAILGWCRFVIPVKEQEHGDGLTSEADNRIRRLREAKTEPPKLRALKFLFLALPALLLFCAFVFTAFLLVMQLIFYIVYTWGDCLNLTTEETVCRDPQMKHGFWGWLAEVSCDILLVLIFEISLPLGESLAKWMANLIGFEFAADRKYFVWSVQLMLASFESLAFRACYGFIFTPQWTKRGEGNQIDGTFCAIFRTWCQVQEVLEVEDRRYIFERLTKGPFVVAPFISILMKCITPMIAEALNYAAHSFHTTSFAVTPVRAVTRILALIFAYDGGHAGGAEFVIKGRPWKDANVTHPELPTPGTRGGSRGSPDDAQAEAEAEAKTEGGAAAGAAGGGGGAAAEEEVELIAEHPAEAKLKEAMQQYLLKRFEPFAEILEVNITFIGVLFFAPIMPWGVLALLVAKVLEVSFGMVKMLYVRRRAYPEPDVALRRSEVGFMFAATVGATGWHVGLELITYNDEWYAWGIWRAIVMGLVLLWMAGAAMVLLLYNYAHRVDAAKLEAAFLAARRSRARRPS